jgi:hypothetical protein
MREYLQSRMVQVVVCLVIGIFRVRSRSKEYGLTDGN